MKTVKQIADALGIDKQKVYRYIKKNHISEVHQSGSKMYYDDTVEAQIIKDLSEHTVSDEAHQSTSKRDKSLKALEAELLYLRQQHAMVTAKLVSITEELLRLTENNQILVRELNLRALAETTAEPKPKRGFWDWFMKK